MKKYIAITLVLFFIWACNSKEMIFRSTHFESDFASEKKINLNTGKLSLITNQIISIRKTPGSSGVKLGVTISNGKEVEKIIDIKTINNNARSGRKLMEGFDPVSGEKKSIRIIYVDWWKNPDVTNIIASPIMSGGYQEKNDTIDVYYKCVNCPW